MGSSDTERPFRLGLVGAGRMGRTHLRALASSSDVRVVAVAEPVASLCEEVSSVFGITTYATTEDMVSAGGLDGVVIVTPSDTHVAVIETVAAAGLPILCEKPCGVVPADTRRARDIVTAAGVPLQVAYWRRFVPALVSLRHRILSGHFGDLLTLTSLQWDGEPPSGAFRARSGGVFVDMGVHEFDQLRWLTSSDITSLSAESSDVVTDPSAGHDPDSAQVLCKLSRGATAFVTLGRYYASGDVASVDVFGTKDHVAVTFLDPREGDGVQLEALSRQASAFAVFARGGERLGASVDDALAALEAAAHAEEEVRRS